MSTVLAWLDAYWQTSNLLIALLVGLTIILVSYLLDVAESPERMTDAECADLFPDGARAVVEPPAAVPRLVHTRPIDGRSVASRMARRRREKQAVDPWLSSRERP